jgi:hypothetical protein
MPLDPGIFAPYVPRPLSPLDIQSQLMQQDLVHGQLQQQGLALRQAQAIDAQRSGLRQAVQSGQLDLSNPDHQTQALAQFPDVAPALVDQITKRADVQSQQKLRDAQASEHAAKARADVMDVATRHLAAANPLDDESMVQAFQKAADAGLYGSDKKKATDAAVAEIDQMPPKENVQARLDWYQKQLGLGLGMKDALELQRQKASDAEGARHNLAGETESAREHKSRDAIAAGQLGVAQGRLALERQTAGTPAGFEADPAAPPGVRQLRPIAGGPHDPNGGGGQGSRSELMFNRVVSAANEATAALKNISDLPITSSTGIFGTAQAGTSLLGSARSVLAQKVTGQEAQDTKVMFAGVARALGAIETSGLQVNGSLIHSMESVTLNEGDTQMTKLRKLAEVRQIVEKGLEPNLSNPKIPEAQKEMVRGIIRDVQAAVPYTHGDITRLQQSKNPQATISDFAKSSGVQPGAATVKPGTVIRYDAKGNEIKQ